MRQFYVSNTRFKDGHRLYAHNLSALKSAVANRSERLLAREFVRDLGKELGALLQEQAHAKQTVKPGDIERAKQREVRIRALLREVAGHERRAKSRASFRAFREKLGIDQMPAHLVQWLKGRRKELVRQHSKNSFRAYAMARSIRQGRKASQWFERARAGMRSLGRRR